MPEVKELELYLRVVDQEDSDAVFSVARRRVVAAVGGAAARLHPLRVDGDAEAELPPEARGVEPEVGGVEAVALVLGFGPGGELMDGPLDAVDLVHGDRLADGPLPSDLTLRHPDVFSSSSSADENRVDKEMWKQRKEADCRGRGTWYSIKNGNWQNWFNPAVFSNVRFTGN